TQRGLSVTLAGLTLAAGGALWALGSFAQSRPRLEPHRERLVVLGMSLVTVAVGCTPLVLVESVPVWCLALAMGIGCFGMGLTISSLSVLLLRLSAPQAAGRNSAALQLCDGLSNVLLLALTGALFAALGGGAVTVTGAGGADATGAGGPDAAQPTAFAAVYAVSAVVALAGVAVARRLRPELPAGPEPAKRRTPVTEATQEPTEAAVPTE
ncbi:MFS transporter, partial [Streptomyces nanshensis]